MFKLDESNRFWLYNYATDMRKSFFTLSGIVNNIMGKKLSDGDAFIFINKSRNRMKILHKEKLGLVLYCLKMDYGTLGIRFNDEGKLDSVSMSWKDLCDMIERTVNKREYQKRQFLMKKYL